MNLVDFSGGPIPKLEDIAVKMNGPIGDDPADIIPGLLPKQGQLVIAGETNIGKSLTAIEICSCLATGQKLWGELEPVSKANKILYVLGEHYVEVIQRLAALTRLPFPDSVFLIGPEQLGYDKWLVANGRPNLQAIGKFKKWTEGCDLIVFDPFSSFMTGEGSENDNIGARLVLDSMSLIAQTAGASCLVLAHQGKPHMGPDGKEYSRKSYAIRGASGIEDAATNIFYMGKARGESEAAQHVAKDQIFSITCRKYKGEAPSEYRLLRDPLTLTHQLLGNRPYIEVKRLAVEGQVGKLVSKLNIGRDEAIRIIAALNDCHERTVRRDLGLP